MHQEEQRTLLPDEVVLKKIYFIRGQKVMLDRDLAELYGVETKVLNQAVRRHLDRFPGDFMFQLSESELGSLRSQFVIDDNDFNLSAFRGRKLMFTAPHNMSCQNYERVNSWEEVRKKLL